MQKEIDTKPEANKVIIIDDDNNISVSNAEDIAVIVGAEITEEVDSTEGEEAPVDKLFGDNIRLAKAGNESIELPDNFADSLQELFDLEAKYQAISKQLSNKNKEVEEEALSYMKSNKYSEMKTCYYDFYLHLEVKPRDIDKARLRREKPEIYSEYERPPKQEDKLSKHKSSTSVAEKRREHNSMFYEKAEVETESPTEVENESPTEVETEEVVQSAEAN
jgi:hypothetical protein